MLAVRGPAGGAGGAGGAAQPSLSNTPAWFSKNSGVQSLQSAPVGHFVRVSSGGGVSTTPTPQPPGGAWSFPGTVAPGGQAQIVYAGGGGTAGPGVGVNASANTGTSADLSSSQSTTTQSSAGSGANGGPGTNGGADADTATGGPRPPAEAKPPANPRQDFVDFLKQGQNDRDPPFPRPYGAEDASANDIAAFKRVSKIQPGQNEEKELKYLRDIRAKYPNTYAHLSDDEMLIIRRYTGNDYNTLNPRLRTGKGADLADWKAYERALNAALSKLPRYQGPTVRGAKTTKDNMKFYEDAFQEGKIAKDPAFTSSAAGSEAPQAFAGDYEFHIHGKNGRIVEDLGNFSPYKDFDVSKNKWDPADHEDGVLQKNNRVDHTRESEVLFASNTEFLVQAREENVRVFDSVTRKFKTVTIIRMAEL